MDELLEAAQQLEQLREAHAGSTGPALEKLVAYASLDDKAKEGQEAPLPSPIASQTTTRSSVQCPCSQQCTSPRTTCWS